MPARLNLPDGISAPPQARGQQPETARGLAPVIVLSYAHSGAAAVQRSLAEGTEMACTQGTGILPLCEVAAASWAQVDGRPGKAMSRLAVSSIRALVSVQLTVLLTTGGKRRWCELATSPPSAAGAFLQIFPAARVICVHRRCADVISAAATAQPWGLAGSAMAPYAFDYPGNSLAAIAAYWVSATERLLAFEAAHPQATNRLRYEDAVPGSGRALGGVRSCLQLKPPAEQDVPPDRWVQANSGPGDQEPLPPPIPAEMIPPELRGRIGELQAELGYSTAAGGSHEPSRPTKKGGDAPNEKTNMAKA